MQISFHTVTDDPHLRARQPRFNIGGQGVQRPQALLVKWPINQEPCWEPVSVGLVRQRGKRVVAPPVTTPPPSVVMQRQREIITIISQTGDWIITGIAMFEYIYRWCCGSECSAMRVTELGQTVYLLMLVLNFKAHIIQWGRLEKGDDQRKGVSLIKNWYRLLLYLGWVQTDEPCMETHCLLIHFNEIPPPKNEVLAKYLALLWQQCTGSSSGKTLHGPIKLVNGVTCFPMID